MNLGEMKTRLRRYGFDASDPLASWINEAYHEVEDEEDWPFLDVIDTIPTVAGSDTIALPSDFFKLYTIRRSDGSTYLEYYDRVKWERVVTNQAATGYPTVFTLLGLDGVKFSPIPTVVEDLTVFYQRKLEDMVNDVDEPAWPARHHSVILYRAAAIALQNENEEERAVTAQDQYETALLKMTRAYGRKQKGQPATVQDTMGYY